MHGPTEQPGDEPAQQHGDHADQPVHLSKQLSTARLEAFSDGVFAIAVTLLVLDLKVPESPERLLQQLFAEWPSLLGYLVSFSFISASWIAHAGLTHLLRNVDAVFLGLNLLLLLLVSFLPFTTSLFTKHLTDSGERVAVVAFGLNLTLERDRWLFVVLITLSTAVSAFHPKIAVIFYLGVSALLITSPIWRLHRWRRARRHP